jgi:hypothetical protein
MGRYDETHTKPPQDSAPRLSGQRTNVTVLTLFGISPSLSAWSGRTNFGDFSFPLQSSKKLQILVQSTDKSRNLYLTERNR